MKTVITMNNQGRLTLPAAARQALHLEGPAQFELEISGDALILRPAVVIPREDAWAYTPEHLRRVARSMADVQEGRTRRLSEDDLIRLTGDADTLSQ